MKLPPNHQSHSQEKALPAAVVSPWQQINENAAGIDLGSGEHWVCVPADRADKNVRRFGCFTPDLIALVN